VKRVRQHRRIKIMRDDHIGDQLGALFFDVMAQQEDSILARLAEYLGKRVRIVKAEISNDCVEVEVEVQVWEDEANRLTATANDLLLKGARRNAQALFREALELDPLNAAAATALGTFLADLEQYNEALSVLKLAREAGPESAALMLALGRVCIKTDRKASAITYLERAYEIEPSNFAVRRALAELGRKPKPSPRSSRPDPTKSSEVAPEKPANKQH
jgi:tetratricopeptide (TPR) repeat protein